MSEPVATVLGAIVGFVGGLLVAWMGYRQKSDELFFRSFDFLGGGTQKRNLGIAAIELYWSRERHRRVSVSLLIGSALYLLLACDKKDTAHELHNLDRIMSLLLTQAARAASLETHYVRLKDAVEAAKNPDRDRGLEIPQEWLEAWEAKLHRLVTQRSVAN